MIQSIERAMLVINILAEASEAFFTVQKFLMKQTCLLAQFTDYYIH